MTVIDYCRAYQKDRNCIQGDFEGKTAETRLRTRRQVAIAIHV